MPRHHDARLKPLELFEHGDPAVAVHVRVVGWEKGKDREHVSLNEISRKKDSLLGEKHDLIASRVRKSPRPKPCGAVTEVKVDGAVVNDISVYESSSVELVGDRISERAEHFKIRLSLVAQLEKLVTVINDCRAVGESLRP